jgi:stage II sporulation protein M
MPDYRRILWDGRRWIIASMLLFFAGGLAGYIYALLQPDAVLEGLRPAVARLQEIGQRLTSNTSPLERTSIIFRNNGLVALWMMVLGVFMFGLVPALASVVNGALIGAVLGLGNRLLPDAPSLGTVLLSTLPHGVIELPAIWIASAWGMKLGLAWLLPGASGRRVRVLGRTALEGAQVFVLVAVLLLLAAVIEANVTLALVRSAQAAQTAAGIL